MKPVQRRVLELLEQRIKDYGLASMINQDWAIDSYGEGNVVSELRIDLLPIRLTDAEYNSILAAMEYD